MTTGAKHTISVIIPTFRRWPFLVETVRHINAQTRPPDEIVIVDQTPRQEMPEGQPGDLIAESRARIVYDHQSAPLVYRARNRGALLSCSEILLYLDDDVIPERELVSHHLRIMEDSSVDAVCGYIGRPGGTETTEKRSLPSGDIEEIAFDWAKYTNAGRWERIPRCSAGHFSIRKSVLAEMGGWDERIVTYGDKDLGLRLYRAGKNVVYDPAPRLIHLMAPEGGLRLTDPRSPWSSWERCVSFFYVGFRHLRGKYFWKYAVFRAARASFLLRRNATNPLCWPRELWGFVKAFWVARRWAKQGVLSSFPGTAAPEAGSGDTKTVPSAPTYTCNCL